MFILVLAVAHMNYFPTYGFVFVCFLIQDKLLDKHIAEDTFNDQPLQDIGRPVKSLLVRFFCVRLTNFFHFDFLQLVWQCLDFLVL